MRFLQYHMKVISICIQIDRNGEKFMERNSRNSQGYKLNLRYGRHMVELHIRKRAMTNL